MRVAAGFRHGQFHRAFSGQSKSRENIEENRLYFNNLFTSKIQDVAEEMLEKRLLDSLLDRKWLLSAPESMINCISIADTGRSLEAASPLSCSFSNNKITPLVEIINARRKKDLNFFLLRDDLLHPLINGNKARKLDALLPVLGDHKVTDVVTCGGCQSAHAAAVAVSCSERGITPHLLLRGEEPQVLTGYNLVSKMFGNVCYVPRSVYAKRGEMLAKYADLVAGSSGLVVEVSHLLDKDAAGIICDEASLPPDAISPKVIVINEGAGDAVGLLGVIRLVVHLSQNHLFGKGRRMKIVVDAGTGTTAIGLALGAFFLRLPWEITAVMLAVDITGYKRQEKRLITELRQIYPSKIFADSLNREGRGNVQWVNRLKPRKFGNVLEGEVETCRKIAMQTGIFLDPIYTLAAWEQATHLCLQEAEAGEDAQVVMLHTGGTLGMFGLAQRYKSHFQFPQPLDAPW